MPLCIGSAARRRRPRPVAAGQRNYRVLVRIVTRWAACAAVEWDRSRRAASPALATSRGRLRRRRDDRRGDRRRPSALVLATAAVARHGRDAEIRTGSAAKPASRPPRPPGSPAATTSIRLASGVRPAPRTARSLACGRRTRRSDRDASAIARVGDRRGSALTRIGTGRVGGGEIGQHDRSQYPGRQEDHGQRQYADQQARPARRLLVRNSARDIASALQGAKRQSHAARNYCFSFCATRGAK